jgi:hypothetical protein
MSRTRTAAVGSGLVASGLVGLAGVAIFVAVVIVRPGSPSIPSPYVITAIDNHFHDAHPTKPIDPRQTLIVTNQGRSLHNVTFPGTGFSQDIPPGGRVVIPNIGQLLAPGEALIVCSYHSDVGMFGTVVIKGG